MLKWFKRTKPPAAPPAPARPAESLLDAQHRLSRGQAQTVIDVGTHRGHSAQDYLERFPTARVFGIEADATNFADAQTLLARYGSRIELSRVAVAAAPGEVTLHVNSHDGTHSLLPIGEQRFWGGFAKPVTEVTVPAVTLDGFCAEHGIARVDILKMDIQGGELAALQGAAGLLARGAIGMIALEVNFHSLYADQPLFWDIGQHLRQHGYAMYGLYDHFYHPHNPAVLSWADALFLSPAFLSLPEWTEE